ncbi:hypothetical protein CferDRAFT_1658 [Chlorobium ferrooxidans DSM 13031]|uniref:Uncharacterized protein n=1 Tax=Chlorobium ferrooxidans DSM 13031 TaxID=377431 RepID=Q0YTI8_9CHLB|nr:hypothetical protein CferDRAFT_1658 [Chlorobium ferrooxidans DSM 13031]
MFIQGFALLLIIINYRAKEIRITVFSTLFSKNNRIKAYNKRVYVHITNPEYFLAVETTTERMRQFSGDNPSHFHEIVSFYKTYTEYRYIKFSGFMATFSPKIVIIIE